MHSKIWTDMFVLGLPWLEKVLRPAIIYVFLVVGLRLGGKRELAQLNPFDLVVLLTLSNTVQNAIIGDDVSITGGIIGASTLLVINYVVVRFLFKHPALDHLIEGDQDVLIDTGKINTGRLNKEAVTMAELAAAAHRQGFASLREVDRAVLEPGGIISFLGKKPSPEDTRHSELLERLDRITRDLAQLRAGA
ncbi:MAG TPA: YetF domain-containing protein [Terriglobia bacterium]|nr:YetF domain-containing protein [Terriglobia bacterium]